MKKFFNSDAEKKIVLDVVGGDPRNLNLIYTLFQYKHFYMMMGACIKSGLIGQKFYTAFQDVEFCHMKMASYLLKKVHKDKTRKLQGLDFAKENLCSL